MPSALQTTEFGYKERAYSRQNSYLSHHSPSDNFSSVHYIYNMSKNYCKKCNKETRPRPAHANNRNHSNSPPTTLPSPKQTAHNTVADDFAPAIDEQHWIVITNPTQDQQPTQTAEPTYVILSPPSTPQTSANVPPTPTYPYYENSRTVHPIYSGVVPPPVPENPRGTLEFDYERWPPRNSRGQTPMEQARERHERRCGHSLQYGRPSTPNPSIPHRQRARLENMSNTAPSSLSSPTGRDVPSTPSYLTSRDHETFASENDGRVSRLGHYSRPTQSSVVGRNAQGRSVYTCHAVDTIDDTVEYGSSEESEEEGKTLRMEKRWD